MCNTYYDNLLGSACTCTVLLAVVTMSRLQSKSTRSPVQLHLGFEEHSCLRKQIPTLTLASRAR